MVNSQNWAVSWTHNFARRNLNTAQKALVANSLRAHYDAEAKRRQVEGAQKGGQASPNAQQASGNIATTLPKLPVQAQSRDKVAKLVGIGARSADKARTGRPWRAGAGSLRWVCCARSPTKPPAAAPRLPAALTATDSAQPAGAFA